MKLSMKEFDAMQMGWRKWYIEKVELKTFKKFGLDIKGLDILEVGCGSGFAASLITAEQPHSYTGLDIMPEQLKIAKGRNLPSAYSLRPQLRGFGRRKSLRIPAAVRSRKGMRNDTQR